MIVLLFIATLPSTLCIIVCIQSLLMKHHLSKYLLALTVIILVHHGYGQVDAIETHYSLLEKEDKRQAVTVSFIQKEDSLVEDYDRLSQIILIRHGEPALYKKGWRKRSEVIQFVHDYDSVGVYSPSFEPIQIQKGELKTIHVSAIPRAISTAQQIISQHELFQTDSIFREFERKIFRFPNLKLPIKFYLTGSRIFWLMGWNDKGIESKKLAKERSRKAAEILITDADQNGKSLLIAHGFLNRYLEKYLKKQGWVSVFDGGHHYLSQKVLVKEKK